MELILGTRKSKLAQYQADKVGELLKKSIGVDYKKMLVVTEGDRRLDVTLNKIGGKGLFIKEIEMALLDGRADCAVHSLKDVPFELPKEFELLCIPEREDVRDAFVSSNGIPFRELRKGAIIGTSSIRRAEQLRLLRSDLKIVPIRGNVQTRLEKMKNEGMDGIILASAGLKRLELENIITDYFSPEEIVPAVGQGALAIETLKECKYKGEFLSINNEELMLEILGERSFMKSLNGGCHSLIGAYSKREGTDYYLLGIFQVGNTIVKKDISGKLEDSIILGEKLGKDIISNIRG
ncbi:MAG: hydroxymethylbilane synthase [Clostridium sp.]